MYKKILVPLDGSATAEKVLPYVRTLAGRLKSQVELLGIIDIAELATRVSPEKARFLDTIVEEGVRESREYLAGTARTFMGGDIKCTIDKGRAAEMIVEKGESDRTILIAMATHGRSGIKRWLLGSVAEKVLRGTANPLLLVRAADEAKSEGLATLNSIVVPLDGSEVAESVLPAVVEMAQDLDSEIVLFRACNVPHSIYGGDGRFATKIVAELIGGIKGEARDYLEKKTKELRERGAKTVSYVLKEGIGADQIIALAHKTPDNLIVMCSQGWSGGRRWLLGSVTETVVRHTEDPVLILRPG
jgi:nucleotide-binding universal stress UspA family protein